MNASQNPVVTHQAVYVVVRISERQRVRLFFAPSVTTGESERHNAYWIHDLGRILRPYKFSSDILTKVRNDHDDPAVRIKLDDIIRAVERP